MSEGTGGCRPAPEPATVAGAVAVLNGLRPGMPGVPAVTALLVALAASVVAAQPGPVWSGADESVGEFAGTLTVQLVRPYLRAVRAAGCGQRLPEVWWPVFEAFRLGIDQPRLALAAGHALVDHDLPIAVVSSCTLLGCAPGEAQRRQAVALAAVLAAGAPESDESGWWAQVQRLWAVRGRPAETAAERSALEQRVVLAGRALLGQSDG